MNDSLHTHNTATEPSSPRANVQRPCRVHTVHTHTIHSHRPHLRQQCVAQVAERLGVAGRERQRGAEH
eukprot:189237-Chlamydomonas_euryale.AAC.3